MKVARHLVKARREQLASLLQEHRYLPLAKLCRRLRVSEATARRDLASLAHDKVITRTYGGALVDFGQRFPSFLERLHRARAAKRQIAVAALRLIKPSMVCFFDSGTTVYAIAEALTVKPVANLTVVTNNLPVADILSDLKGLHVEVIAGQYLSRQSILMGEQSRRSLRLWKFDAAFLSAEGMTQAGLWNSQKDVVKFQRTVVDLVPRLFFCLDAGKLEHEAAEFLLKWPGVHGLITDATAEELKEAAIHLTGQQRIVA